MALRDGNHHPVPVHVGYVACEIEETDMSCPLQIPVGHLGAEEDHRLAVLEVVVNLLIGLACDLDAVLVEGVEVGTADV